MTRSRAHRGFTIIEMMVVIIIIGILLGLLAPALSGVKRQAAIRAEQANLRTLHQAWMFYAKSFDDAAMPGYLNEDVQSVWGLNTKLPNNAAVPPQAAGPYTWRLLEYMSDNVSVLGGYRDINDPLDVGNPRTFAEEPAFGYNALYIGGWWQMETIGGNPTPRYRFANARADRDGDGVPNERYGVVARSLAQIERSSEVIVFSGSTHRPPGFYKINQSNQREFPGSHYVVPPIVARDVHWQLTSRPLASAGSFGLIPNFLGQQIRAGGLDEIDVLVEDSVPYARFGKQVSVVHVDGSVASETFSSLADQRKWIHSANASDFRHLED
ncbi:MAG: prepilin-type N-terminal cleavage/methylation domain-containing protein [Phycisphaerales bacterium]|nr:prepilin-type N-terminal cleavage/methylation domain-containing protein [Phycisphaerales bacterium]